MASAKEEEKNEAEEVYESMGILETSDVNTLEGVEDQVNGKEEEDDEEHGEDGDSFAEFNSDDESSLSEIGIGRRSTRTLP
jgi:hypothetical protein